MKQYIADAQTGEIIKELDDATPKNRFLAPGEQPPPWAERPQPSHPAAPSEEDFPSEEATAEMNTPAGMALVRIDPGADAVIIALGTEILRINRYAQITQVIDQDTARSATNDLGMVANLKKAIEEKRRNYKAPLLEYAKRIDAAFVFITSPLEAADKTLRQKLIDYNQKIEAERQRIIDINRLKEQAAFLEAEAAQDSGQEAPPQPKLERIPDIAPEHFRADIGAVGITTTIDREKVDQAVAKGCKDIPGIYIWFEPKWKVLNLKLVPEEYKRKNTRLTTKKGEDN